MIFWHIALICQGFCQNSFLKFVHDSFTKSASIDDIVLYRDEIYIRGTVFVQEANLFGFYISKLDTFGNSKLLFIKIDSTYQSDLITDIPTRLTINSIGEIFIPHYYYHLNDLAIAKLDNQFKEIFSFTYPQGGSTIFPIEIIPFKDKLYLFGNLARSNLRSDNYMLCVDQNGIQQKFTTLGFLQHDEYLDDVFLSADGTFIVSSTRLTDDFIQNGKIKGWRRPWIYAVDTLGNIVWEWLGEENDERTLAGGPFCRLKDGSWLLVSNDYKEVFTGFGTEVWWAYSIARLDSQFNLMWKDTLHEFAYALNDIVDMEYDSIRDEYILVGDRYIDYPEKVESEIWVIKMKDTGEILWELTDTLTYGKQEIHYTAGVTVAPSGSIYVAGYYRSEIPSPHTRGWLMKVTPDGCIDTLCGTTSMTDPILPLNIPIVLSPNPVSTTLQIDWDPGLDLTECRIYDAHGRFHGRHILSDPSTDIMLDLAPGMYFCILRDKTGIVYTERFIKL